MKVEGDITCWLCVYFIYVSVVVSESISGAMPSGSALISGGISLGVIASFISGVYYVLTAGLKWMGKLQDSLQTPEEKRADKWSCARCGRDLSRVKTGPSRRVQCARCSSLVCRNCCSKTSAASWICSNCRKYRDITLQTGEWFYEQLKKRFYSTVATIPGNPNQDGEVRDFMERIVEEMVGGELDNVSLRPLSEHPEYVKFSEKHHDELAHTLAKFSLALQMAVTDKILPDSDSPSAIHEELKELIKRIIKEAMMLPSLQNYSNGSNNKEPLNGEVNELEKKSYEDILATAVINKIVERYQNELYNYEINNSRSSLRDTNGNVVRRRKLRRQRLTAGLTEVTNSSDSEGSAAYTNDEYSWSGSSRTDPLSLTIEECIEEVVTKYSSDEDPEEPDSEFKHFLSGLNFRRRQRAPFPEFGMDVVDKRHSSSSSSSEEDVNEENDNAAAHRVGVEVVSPVESWEENWLFQRRRLKTACLSQSMPVPMLVPNPSQDEPRARIGDVDIDETSDLSDCSDSALEDIIGSEPDVRHTTKLNLSLNQETSSDENSDSEDDFFLTNYNRNVIKSIDNMKPKVNGICNGNIDHNLTIHKIKVDIVNEEDNMDTEFCSNTLDSTSPSQAFPANCNINEARNHELIVPQVDSGEGSLEMQQDREYTVEYDAPVRVHVNQNQKSESANTDSCIEHTNASSENKTLPLTKDNGLSSREKPTPKPRSSHTAHQEEKTEEKPSNLNKAEDETDGKENFDTLLMTPPRPGTIAEREHLKWQKAVPLTNNPYSKENIERRQRERLLLSRQSSGDISVEFPELTGANDSSVVHIDCSGRKPDYKQYGRDYYINTGGVKKDTADKDKERERPVETEKTKTDSNEKSSTDKSPVKQEDKPQVSVRVEVEVGRWPNSGSVSSNGNNTVSSVETRTHITDLKDDEQHLTTISTSTASANNDNLNDKHHKVTTVSTWNSKNKNNKDNSNYISLPSVKKLAKQFSTNESNEQVAPVITTPVQKRLEVQTSPIKQVHSLTARCISKEFREGLRAANQPKTYQVKPIEKIDNNCGNISDDSGTASPTPSGGNPKLYNSIAFWEQMKSSRQ